MGSGLGNLDLCSVGEWSLICHLNHRCAIGGSCCYGNQSKNLEFGTVKAFFKEIYTI